MKIGSNDPKEKGRHCDKCSKQVVDFTQMADGEIVDYMQKHPGSCGRFYNFQLNKELSPAHKPKNKWLTKAAVSTLALTQLIPQEVNAQNHQMVETDSICDTQLSTSYAFGPSNIHAISFNFNPNNKHIKALKRIVVDIDSFQIAIDTLESGNISFSLPKGISSQEFRMHLYRQNNSSPDTVYVNFKQITDQFRGQVPFNLSFSNGRWQVAKNVVWEPYLPQDVIIMGIPPEPYDFPFSHADSLMGYDVPYWLFDSTIPIPNPEFMVLDTHIVGFSVPIVGNVIIADPDASKLERKLDSLQKETDLEIASESIPSNNWRWALGVLLTFVGAIATFVLTGKKK